MEQSFDKKSFYWSEKVVSGLSLFKSVFLALVEQICLAGAEVDDLGASVAVFFLYRALLAIKSKI